MYMFLAAHILSGELRDVGALWSTLTTTPLLPYTLRGVFLLNLD